MTQRVIDTPGIVAVAIVAAAMALWGYVASPLPQIAWFQEAAAQGNGAFTHDAFTHDAFTHAGGAGLYAPSPAEWFAAPGKGSAWGFVLNLLLVFIACMGTYLLNKSNNLIRTGQPIWATLLVVYTASMPVVSGSFNSGAPMLLLVLLMLAMLFDNYKARSAPRTLFGVGTCIGLGAIFNHAALLFILPVVLAAISLKCFRWREAVGFALGIIVPYWILLGLGLCRPWEIHLPELTTPASIMRDAAVEPYRARIMYFIISGGCGIFAAAVLSLKNAIRLFAGNSKIRICNNAVNYIGLTSVGGMCIDFGNADAYIMVCLFWITMQFANFLTLEPLAKPRVWYWVLQGVAVTAGAVGLCL